MCVYIAIYSSGTKLQSKASKAWSLAPVTCVLSLSLTQHTHETDAWALMQIAWNPALHDLVLISATPGLSCPEHLCDLHITNFWHNNALEGLYNHSYENFICWALHNTTAGGWRDQWSQLQWHAAEASAQHGYYQTNYKTVAGELIPH